MNSDEATLAQLIAFLSASVPVKEKIRIRTAYEPAQEVAGATRLGDDCAAIPDGPGWLLFAAEGMLPSFVADDPWFAGYSAVMVNLSDVSAMGGRSLAIVDVLWAPGLDQSGQIWEGMRAASKAYGVPIVGGHTTVTTGGAPFLAAAVLGKAKHLITSFDAKAGDDLLVAVDLRGAWRGQKPFWNASVCEPSAGAELRVDELPRPAGVDLARWLISFPSFGYLLSVSPNHREQVIAHFASREIACAVAGRINSGRSLLLGYGSARAQFPLSEVSDPHARSL